MFFSLSRLAPSYEIFIGVHSQFLELLQQFYLCERITGNFIVILARPYYTTHDYNNVISKKHAADVDVNVIIDFL